VSKQDQIQNGLEQFHVDFSSFIDVQFCYPFAQSFDPQKLHQPKESVVWDERLEDTRAQQR
jgi:hypothetical protein